MASAVLRGAWDAAFQMKSEVHFYSPELVVAIEQYAAFMQGAIEGWKILLNGGEI